MNDDNLLDLHKLGLVKAFCLCSYIWVFREDRINKLKLAGVY